MPRFIMTVTAVIDAPVAPTLEAQKRMAKGFATGVNQVGKGWKCEGCHVEVEQQEERKKVYWHSPEYDGSDECGFTVGDEKQP